MESERVERLKYNSDVSKFGYDVDNKLSKKIRELLADPKIDEYSMVDAYYYDYSVIPQVIQDKHKFFRDVYLIFGITNDGEIVSKWVGRYELENE